MNNPFDRVIINLRERPVSTDIDRLQSQMDRDLRETMMRLCTGRDPSSGMSANPVSGFFGDGFKPKPLASPGLGVRVTLGLGFQYLPGDVPTTLNGIAGVDDLSPYKPLILAADATVNGIPAHTTGGQDRIDLIEARMNRVVGEPASRDVFNPTTGLFEPTSVNKNLSFMMDGSTGVVTSPALSTAAVSVKVGVPASSGTAVAPTVTPGYVVVGYLFSKNGNMASITRANIRDTRNLLAPYGAQPFSVSFQMPTGNSIPATSIVANVPAGVEVVVVKQGAPLNNQFEVFLVGGAFPSAATMACTVTRSGGYSASEILIAEKLQTFVGTLTGGVVTTLQNAGVSAPALVFAEGAPFTSGKFAVLRQAAGVTDATMPDPLLVEITGFVQRY